MKQKYILLFSILVTSFFFSCKNEELTNTSINNGSVTVDFRTRSSGQNNSSVDGQINSISGFRFENNLLKETFPDINKTYDGLFYINPSQKSGNVYFLANAAEVLKEKELKNEVTTLDDFMKISSTAISMQADGITMSGKLDLSENINRGIVTMQRSLARIDIESLFEGVQVHRVIIKDIAKHGYVNPSSSLPEFTEKEDIVLDFNTPIITERKTIAYVCEQSENSVHNVEVEISIDGAFQTLRTSFSNIKRNNIYTIKLKGNGAYMQLYVQDEDWGSESFNDAGLIRNKLIDVESSQLSEGVRINETRDTVFIPYYGSDFRLALKTTQSTKVEINGDADGSDVAITESMNTQQTSLGVSVSSVRRMPGDIKEYVYIDIYDNNIHKERVVLFFEQNPIILTGLIDFDGNGVCDFNTYVEGELGRIVIPEGKIAEIEFDSDETHWIKLDSQGNNTYRILGGWKPNDPKADGSTQEARLIVRTDNETHTETYIIKRKNYGLPVININGVWWCKYNLRGNVKNFGDQITIAEDIEIEKQGGIYEYLKNCDESKLPRLLGDQYQAGNLDGLPLKFANGKFFYEGMQSSAQNFGLIDATIMAPYGYEVPDFEDYGFFTANNNQNLGGPGQHSYNNRHGEPIILNIHERDVNLLEQKFGIIDFYDFEYKGNHWVLFGLGHQWSLNPGDIDRMNILLATSNTGDGNTWNMEGYAQSDRPNQNWFKYAGHNSTKTRTLRCIKSPVEYIIE